ncbi:DMT family transporter [Anaerovorax sp. IOR16]|uniref:DMT family transporter n=1 Tax=Anaerovorax sp. IOR16 TaxID=2773458 RepID=UPI0019D24274|nr:SMR family transporter [Anaerovorax sp. IOR16]
MEYFYLFLAIVGELIGTTFLKYSEGFTKLIPSILTLLFYGFCFFFFSKSLININLSIAYATWSAVGLIVSALISVFIFKEGITIIGIIAIIIIAAGVIVLNLFGTPSH